MTYIAVVLFCQIALLVYHQTTTIIDFYPFNGARNYAAKERIAEAGVNAVLMSLAPIGFAFHVRGLMIFGVVYYFVLFAIEIVIWWIPYFFIPTGAWRVVYNFLLSCATSSFEPGDALDRWREVHHRIHAGTITVLPKPQDRIVPNLEHMILHAWTAITACVTAMYFFGET